MYKYFSPLFFLFLFSFSVNAQEMYRVTADKLNVRETKDAGSKKIGFVPQGENVAVIDSSDQKYFKIKVTNGEGWVSKDYLQRINTAPVKQTSVPAPIVEQKPEKHISSILFIIFSILIMMVLMFVIMKFINNKVFKILSASIILLIAYFFYVGFMIQKSVSGNYVTTAELQYRSFNFKSKDSVVIEDSFMDTLTTAPYTIDGDRIKFKQQENTIILLIRDNNTLVGEGFTKGIFTKN